jgi:hypothetical protein
MGDQVTSATLDGEGPKPVPQICLACHGGYYDSSDGLAHEARFLPFDIASFLTVDDVFNNAQTVSDLGLDAFTRLNQLGEFRALNALIKQAVSGPQGPNTEITELIDGWYAGCGGVNSGTCGTCVGPQCQDSFRKNFRPPLWEAQASLHSLYDNVVRVSCRGCHNTQPSFDWTDPDDFTLASFLKTAIERYVCTGQGLPNNQRRMPHAEVPFKTFWQTVLRPDLMEQAPMSFATCDRE